MQVGEFSLCATLMKSAGFDKEPPLPPSTLKQIEIPGLRPFQERWGDFKRCSWPTSIAPTGCEWNSLESPSQHVAEAFARMNDAAWLPQVLDQLSPDDMVVSISHFVPRLELVPEKRFLVSPDLPKVVGSDPLERQIRSVQAQLGLKSAEKRGGDRVGVGEGEGGSAMTKQEVQHMHVFGHTHLPVDLTLEGIRYMQWSLGMQVLHLSVSVWYLCVRCVCVCGCVRVCERVWLQKGVESV